MQLSVGLALGILLGYTYKLAIGPLVVFAIALLVALFWMLQTYKRREFSLYEIAVFSLNLVVGMLVMTSHLPHANENYFSVKDPQNSDTLHLKVTQVLPSNSYADRYYATVLSQGKNPKTGNVLLTCSKGADARPLAVDEEIITQANIGDVPSQLNPYQFNYGEYLNKIGVYGTVKLTPSTWISLGIKKRSLRGYAERFRQTLINRLEPLGFKEAQLGVFRALLLGDRSAIPTETYTAYKNAGVVHILAVSGLHIGVLLLLLEFILKPLEWLRHGKKMKGTLLVLLLWGYAFVAGLSPSVIRAVTMFSFLAYAAHLNRPVNSLNILALSFYFLLLATPTFLFQVGFQMSYAAVAAILWIYPLLQKFWRPKQLLVRKAWELLGVSIAAQLGVLPLSLLYFHQFPALFFVTNLLIVPFLGILLGIGILILFLSAVNLVPSFLISIYDQLLGSMNRIVQWVASQESFLLTAIPFNGEQAVLAYFLIGSWVVYIVKRNTKKLMLALSCSILFTGYTLYLEWTSLKKEQLWLLHQPRNTVLVHQQGKKLNVITKDSLRSEILITAIKIGARSKRIHWLPLQNHYTLRKQKIMVLDSAHFIGDWQEPDFLVLTNSPRLNLDRVIKKLRPKKVFADGSNYLSFIKLWKNTCNNNNIPFHYTGTQGAYLFRIVE